MKHDDKDPPRVVRHTWGPQKHPPQWPAKDNKVDLSEHFTLAEMTASQTALRRGLDNTPQPEQINNLRCVCEWLLEPARKLLNMPLYIDSGYRSPALNVATGGARDSAHMDGRAADIKPIGFPLADAFDILRLNPQLPYDQIIFECLAWIHIAIAPAGQKPRRDQLMASGSPGHWTYQRVA